MHKSAKISLIFNVIIAIFVIFATIAMYTHFEFMGHATLLTEDGINMLQFYTVQSNLLMGIMAVVYAVYDVLLLQNKISKIPTGLSLLKLMFTVGVSVTLLTVVLYLTPITGSNCAALYMNSNLFFHILVPIFAIITFLCFEKTKSIKFRYVLLCLIPTVLYGVYYVINAFTHIVDGKVPYKYDWYLFAQGSIGMTIVVFSVMLIFAYLISAALWRLNRIKVKQKQDK
ncbi:MAG: hypothetical protein IK070_00515 [Clostridia bacterium]|nr:hypothetical protein [Clostridia bacterium]